MNYEINREKQKIDWVVMNMRLEGNPVSLDTASKIAIGEYVIDATIEQHMMINNLTSALALMETLLGMKEEISPNTLNKFYRVISGGKEPVYRKKTPVLFHLSYNPPLPVEIEGELRKGFAELYRSSITDPLKKAVAVHNIIMGAYPFDDYNGVVARTAMEYQLMYSGEDMYFLTMSEQEYNGALTEYMKKGHESEIYENLKLSKMMREGK